MKISLVAAHANRFVIGYRNQLPWHLTADLKRFKQLTWHKPILMGRRTFESLGKALPGRINFVLTQDRTFSAPNCTVIQTIDQLYKQFTLNTELMIVGGETLYRQFINKAHRLYLTQIHADFPGDAFFPRYDRSEWKILSEEKHMSDEKNPFDYTFLELERFRHSAS